MTNSALSASSRKTVGWKEQTIPIRGCHLTLENIKEVYKELSAINRKFGEETINKLERPEDTNEEEWKSHIENLLDDAFCLTVTITGQHDQKLYDEEAEIFDSDDLPNPIETIYFTNINSFRRNANDEKPANQLEVFLDFRKPELMDPSLIVSAATPNASSVYISASDLAYFRAVQSVVGAKLSSHRTWFGFLHKKYFYDWGVWVLALPFTLFFASFYMQKYLPVGSPLEPYRWAFFVYSTGIMMMAYLLLASYAKWAFPLNILAENKDTALKHRIALGLILSYIAYKIADTLSELIINSILT